MYNRKCLAGVFIVFLLLPWVTWGNNYPERYVIGDPQGDWGFPSPFAHNPRGPGYIRVSFLFDTLIWKDAQGFIPALAQSWGYDEKSQTYTFHLRPGALWHDGQPVTAADVAFTVDYLNRHPHPWVAVKAIKLVEVADPLTVRFVLEEPYAPFLEEVAGTMFILPQHIWSQVNDPARFQEPAATIGSGPYRFAEYRREHGFYRFEAFADYYQGKALIPTVCFLHVGNEVLALQGKAVQAGAIPPEAIEMLQKSGFTVAGQPHFWVLKLVFNHQRFPMQERDFRQALAHALDLQDLIARTERGHGIPGSPGLLPPDSPWFSPHVPTYSYDPGRSRELLTSLGYQATDQGWQRNGETLELELLSSPNTARMAEYLQKVLKEIGLVVQIRQVDHTVLDHRVKSHTFDLALSGHGGLGGDPKIINDVTLGKFASEFSGDYQTSEKLSQLLEMQLHTLDEPARRKLVDQIQQLLATELPALPLCYPTQYLAHNGQMNWFFTKGGVAKGVPIFFNKAALLPATAPAKAQ